MTYNVTLTSGVQCIDLTILYITQASGVTAPFLLPSIYQVSPCLTVGNTDSVLGKDSEGQCHIIKNMKNFQVIYTGFKPLNIEAPRSLPRESVTFPRV